MAPFERQSDLLSACAAQDWDKKRGVPDLADSCRQESCIPMCPGLCGTVGSYLAGVVGEVTRTISRKAGNLAKDAGKALVTTADIKAAVDHYKIGNIFDSQFVKDEGES